VEMLNRWLTNHAQMVKQHYVLDSAFRDPSVRATSWYTNGIEKHGDSRLFEIMEEDLGVTPIPNTSFLQVTFTAPDKKDAATIVNTIVRKYLETTRVRSKSELSTRLDTATEALASLEKQLEQAREEKERYIGTSIKEPGVVTGLNVTGEQWRALAAEASRLLAEQLMYKGAWDSLKSLDPSQLALGPQMQINIQQDPQVMALSNALIGYQQQYQALLGRAGPNHRELRSLGDQITATEKALDEVIRRKEEEIRAFQLTSAETAWLNALNAQLALEERIEGFKDAQRDLDAKLARVVSLEDRQEMLKMQYERLAEYVQQLRLLDSSQETINVRQLSPAVEPLRRSFPRWELNMLVGSFLGLLAGVGLALLLEVASTSIRTPRDIV
jgi:succinoglycan biosynthesis transport protein ExoP